MKKIVFLSAVALAVVGIALVLVQPKTPVPQLSPEKVDQEIAAFTNSSIFISPKELHEKLSSAQLVLLDGSHPKGYAKGHIPGAISIGFKGLCRAEGKPGDPLWGTILPKDQLTAKLESFGVTQDSIIIAYSDTFKGPGAGGRAVWQLRMAGLKDVRLLYGGLQAWKDSGYALSTEDTAPIPSTGLKLEDYNENHRDSLEHIAANLNTVRLIDVRSQKEFNGKDTSRGEARAGHIQGAQWLEWTALLNEDASPKPPQQIIAQMAQLGIGLQDDFTLY